MVGPCKGSFICDMMWVEMRPVRTKKSLNWYDNFGPSLKSKGSVSIIHLSSRYCKILGTYSESFLGTMSAWDVYDARIYAFSFMCLKAKA